MSSCHAAKPSLLVTQCYSCTVAPLRSARATPVLYGHVALPTGRTSTHAADSCAISSCRSNERAENDDMKTSVCSRPTAL